EQVFLLERGLAILTCSDVDGNETVIGWRPPGHVLGATAVLLNKPLAATATSTCVCEVRAIEAQAFLRALNQDDTLPRFLNRMQSCVIDAQIRKLSGIGLLNARQRVEEFLWRLSATANHGNKWRGQFPFSHREVAQYLMIRPEYLSQILAELEKEGLVERAGAR